MLILKEMKEIERKIVNVLCSADDIVVLTENEDSIEQLQEMDWIL